MRSKISLSGVFITMVMAIVLISSAAATLIFVQVYRSGMEQSAVTSSDQIGVQVLNTVENYTREMQNVMERIMENMEQGTDEDIFIQNMVDMRSDIVAITTYDAKGSLKDCWSNGRELKKTNLNSQSYTVPDAADSRLNITKPHVESLFVDYYPWVVTVCQEVQGKDGERLQVNMDIRFSDIANYIDNVGIGAHGYVYIADSEGNLIYHPQQQLIYSGLKEEKGAELKEGTHTESEAIYTVRELENCDWKIVGVCYVDEMITAKVSSAVSNLLKMLCGVLIAVFLLGWAFSELFSAPIRKLVTAMREFEKNTENFVFSPISGTTEITTLSNSFGHMVVRLQKLMDQVRQEEVTLRKTELNALQAQINPHFLYNTLDAIAWMCEEGKNEDAEEMVNSLARLFRISISKGHELIPIEKEVQHAMSYLKIEKYRYKNQFTYSFDVQEECLPYLCNKITLQPIIENAIYHGVNQMLDEGEIQIRIYQNDEDIVFEIEDNGVGMSEEQCHEIMHREAGDKTGIGIKNVNDRIKIYFGENYGLSIKSELDEGTCVTIRVPKVEEEEYAKK
ncbi:sensor histidine kinase [Novisyntrophococcus fermenticellae]|uniref:sensor histidine kinase n=1 Tax=Novisyntrophococcus fermenticellae TaxID=2068655 RepID=UPI001E6425D5|nr:sensor histidine kinase [Novisyntrophococcus fermenticellae]